MEIVWVLGVWGLLLVSVHRSESGRCFAQFDTNTGKCSQEIGEAEKIECCQNPTYGYQESEGECHFCGPPVWSPWTRSPCNSLCGDGVIIESRKCFGKSECENDKNNRLIETCIGTCCSGNEGWATWQEWSPCSVTCGGPESVGLRKRKRVCNSSPECQFACDGPSEETEKCHSLSKCPVHGAWALWSKWSACSGPCVDKRPSSAITPTRTRQRTCSNPTPSTDTQPHGNSCPGDSGQTEQCIGLPNCPVDGNWGNWLPIGPCSVTCGNGLQLTNRKCDNPPPEYGGKYCEGESTISRVCESPCPVHGVWTNWSNWGECSSACIPQGQTPKWNRYRSCNNPPPSTNPPGQPCNGDVSQEEKCTGIPNCPVDGVWGQWSPFSPCPVTCGMGQQVQTRACDNPPTQHGGKPCVGVNRQTKTCSTNKECPVNGVWSEWTAWGECQPAFEGKTIKCKPKHGKHNRTRICLHREHNGAICEGDDQIELQYCYDVDGCEISGNWEGWTPWNPCRPNCGKNSKRMRKMFCKLNYSEYKTIVREKPVAFAGRPLENCPGDDGKVYQTCHNAPPCS